MTDDTTSDLDEALRRPAVADAFDAVVNLLIDGTIREDPDTMARAGYTFGYLVDLTGLGSDVRPALLARVHAAAAASLRGAMN